MSAINRESYDVLIAAKVPDDLATAAARSISEELRTPKSDIRTIIGDSASMKAGPSLVEKLRWMAVAGVIAILVKIFWHEFRKAECVPTGTNSIITIFKI